MACAVLIRDGTGAPSFQADIVVVNGRIVEIGKAGKTGDIQYGATQVIDASDVIVSPGFIDPHSHYDSQICWDPLISCSSWHGATSVVMDNFGGLVWLRAGLRSKKLRRGI